MKNRRDYNPEILLRNEGNQFSKTLKACSTVPTSVRMASKMTGISYNSMCWIIWQLENKDEVYFDSSKKCPLTQRLSKTYKTFNFFTIETKTP